MVVDIERKRGRSAIITVRDGGGAVHPGLPFQTVGSFFEERDRAVWRITSATVVEVLDPNGGSYTPERECAYYWRYVVELM